MINHDADMAEYLIAQNRREFVRNPRSPIAMTPQTAKAIDLSGILKMSPAEVDEAVRLWSTAA